MRSELADTGITVTALLPGPTDTEFFERADMEDTGAGTGAKDDPAEVARDGYEALMAGKHHIVAGSFKNKAQVAAARVMPEPVKAETDPALLTEEELRRQLAYLVQFKGDIAHRAALRLRQLNIEHRRRVAVSTF